MTYQVSRNGQIYGPYTLDDLRRYVGSGNILLTDMAKSEEMPDWVPVAQILSTAAAGTAGTAAGVPAVPPPTYAAPSTYPQPSGIGYPDPPNMNWGLELLLGFLTCRLFVFVWNLVIASWANRVQPASKALIWYIAATVLFVLELGSSWTIVISLSHHVHPQHSRYRSLGCSPDRSLYPARYARTALQWPRATWSTPQRCDDLLLRRHLLPVQTQRDQ